MSSQALVLDVVVRMVVPMRREFGRTVDVQRFMRDSAYAREVLTLASSSQFARLREYAERAIVHMRQAHTAAATAAKPAPARAPVAAAAPAAAALAARRREAVRRLIELVGPQAEPIAIEIERASSEEALRSLLDRAHQIIGNARGARAASEFLAATSRQPRLSLPVTPGVPSQ